MNEDDESEFVPVNAALVAGIIPIFPWMLLLFYYPRVWALGTGAVVFAALGFGTVRFVFGVHRLSTTLALTPLLGLIWFAFFYVLFLLVG